ncbi:5-aminovalerate aminotransferase DavT [Rubripirellula obstinata]|uniref:alanine--glyoxylate transaminase n=1 Tax=Rubripirellula obstinata TaxID=406547 RepID=A0A5B1CHU4_9BACT|nr:aspartate aminotransferase family protein [Rubripirellula obstinata]KAA1260126.1 5-aminovalerate aminotransferase DavT [Rubripirellula obstinata]
MSSATSPNLPICDHTPTAYQGPSRDQVLAMRHQYVNPGVLTYYRDPLMIVEGNMQYLWDETGKRYLDGFAGIVTVSVGHCHPHVAAAVKAQAGTLQHTTTIYLHPTIAQFAAKLASKMPENPNGDPLDKTYFTNSGSEANEVAVLMSREFTGNQDVVGLRNGYHGGTSVTMGLTSHGTWKFPTNQTAAITHSHAGYCYRCPYDLEYPSCGLKCAHDIKNVIEYQTNGQIACFIGEPVQGVGGAVVPPPEYFQIVYDIVRQHGGLCIADEVQGGFGRTGKHYWSHQNWGVQPDIVTMAKGIGNGAPLGAVTTTTDVSQTMTNRIHFNTYGGNPVSMASGLATMEVIDAEGIQENADVVGGLLKDGLLDLQSKHELIGDVRGLGLMLGVELVTDRVSKEPAKTAAADLMELTKERGLILGKGGLHGNTLRIKPPMCITKDDAQFMLATLDECLEIVSKNASN